LITISSATFPKSALKVGKSVFGLSIRKPKRFFKNESGEKLPNHFFFEHRVKTHLLGRSRRLGSHYFVSKQQKELEKNHFLRLKQTWRAKIFSVTTPC